MRSINVDYLKPCIRNLQILNPDNIGMFKQQLPHSGVELPLTEVFLDCYSRWLKAKEGGDKESSSLETKNLKLLKGVINTHLECVLEETLKEGWDKTSQPCKMDGLRILGALLSIQELLDKEIAVANKDGKFVEWFKLLKSWVNELEDKEKKAQILQLIDNQENLKIKDQSDQIIHKVQNLFSVSL